MFNENNPLISIIIPVYNAENYIEETLDSLFNQTFKDFELIIIDDGSTDGSYACIQKYLSKVNNRFSLHRQENIGQSGTRNNALKNVSGKYISFLDADDILLPNYLQNMIDATLQGDVDLVITGFRLFNETTKEILEIRNPVQWTEKFDNLGEHTFVYSPCGKLFKTSFIEKYDIEFQTGEQLEDAPYSMMTNILAKKVAVLDYEGYLYRQRENSTIGKTKKINHNPKIPYLGIENAIIKVKENCKKEQYIVLEYCVTKILAGLLTRMYANITKEKRKELALYCYRIMDTYFKDIKKNRYIKINKLKKLPLIHRLAVKLFVLSYRFRVLYPFSLLASKVL